MAYRLSEDAVDDLMRIHQWGVRKYGEVQDDKYYNNRFEQIAQQPYLLMLRMP